MHVGICFFPTAGSAHPSALGRTAESLGFESLVAAEHSHIPACRTSPLPGGGELPDYFHEVLDPFTSLSMAAAATTDLRVGTGVAIVPQRDAIQLAKEVTSLDVLSNGRFLFGIGAGWNDEEMANHGSDPSRRFAIMGEKVEAMRRLWIDDEASYRSTSVTFDRVIQRPAPHQRPHPPILVAGGTGEGLDRAVAYGDGWLPFGAVVEADPTAVMAEVRRRCDAAGRDPDRFDVTVHSATPDRAALAGLREAGVDRALLHIDPDTPEAMTTELHRLAGIAL